MTYQISDSCDNEDCREPHNQLAYVRVTATGDVFCAQCWLVGRGVDDSDALDIVFEGVK